MKYASHMNYGLRRMNCPSDMKNLSFLSKTFLL